VRKSTMRGTSGTQHEVGPVRPCEVRGIGARGGSGATVRGARCRGARREAGGVGACGVRWVHPIGHPDRSISVDRRQTYML
jgi:hypothetical protein